ncbi:hypothetical protein IMCC3317_32270 [Kordia antarctica]|uniref:Uncharacterized protein n=1 Tax=Kordia antarctica TaxID=1218801 RepID=A0A7L4ZPP9_9FLAO|nr:hypothetical protein IMCC3317_32270 [Kordia antarctica]
MNFSKFSPRIQKFLTKNPCYTAEKTKKHSEFLYRTQVKYLKHVINKLKKIREFVAEKNISIRQIE